MTITKEQARELADKYLLHTGRVALRDNIIVGNKSAEGWRITAKTTPIISGMDTEVTTFAIDAETGEVGVSIDISVPKTLRQIDEMNDLDAPAKEEAKAKVREVEKEAKDPIDKKRLESLRAWFKNNAPYLKSIVDLITAILSK